MFIRKKRIEDIEKSILEIKQRLCPHDSGFEFGILPERRNFQLSFLWCKTCRKCGAVVAVYDNDYDYTKATLEEEVGTGKQAEKKIYQMEEAEKSKTKKG